MSWATPCFYCGGPGGELPGADHSFTCPRYRKPLRRLRTIRARKPRATR